MPLTTRMRPRHWVALDYVAGGLTALILFSAIRHALRASRFMPQYKPDLILQYSGLRYFPLPTAEPLALLVVISAGIAVALRRRRPGLTLGVLLIGSMVGTTLTGPDFSVLIYFLPIAYVLYLVASTYERRRDATRVLAAVYITLITDALLLWIGWDGFLNGGSLVSVALCVIVVWTVGYTVRQRRRYAVSLQEEAASKAVAQERLRIARELHDVVAHSMSVIAVQAGYGQYVIDSQPGDARAALGAIQTTSREALDEMRRMLGALRQADDADARGDSGLSEGGASSEGGVSEGGAPDSGAPSRVAADGGAGAVRAAKSADAPLFPAPGLTELDRLVARTAGAGVQVDVRRFGQPRDLPASIDLSAYRIIQEALTNVVKHARTSSCRVLLGYRDDELTIEVTDNGAGMAIPELAGAGVSHVGTALLSRNGTGVGLLEDAPARPDGRFAAPVLSLPGAGHGIIGMRERVTLLGGEFSAGPLPGYGFRVSAHIPLPGSA
jgi:signal transduction histidine kinase